jgi:hypothetical protein
MTPAEIKEEYGTQQKYLQKQGWTMKHQLCATVSSSSDSTFNAQL